MDVHDVQATATASGNIGACGNVPQNATTGTSWSVAVQAQSKRLAKSLVRRLPQFCPSAARTRSSELMLHAVTQNVGETIASSTPGTLLIAVIVPVPQFTICQWWRYSQHCHVLPLAVATPVHGNASLAT